MGFRGHPIHPGLWPSLPRLTGLGALLIRGDIGVNELLLHLLRPLLEHLHQLLEPVINDGTVLAGGRGCTVLATAGTQQRVNMSLEGVPGPQVCAGYRVPLLFQQSPRKVDPPFFGHCRTRCSLSDPGVAEIIDLCRRCG